MEFWQYPPDRNQPPLSEEEMVHTVLDYVATKLPAQNLMHSIDPGWVFVRANIDEFKNFAMHRMVSEGLITTEPSRHSSTGVMITATPRGVRIARSAGGYHAHHAAQRQAVAQDHWAKAENERLTREAAKATIDAAAAAKLSVSASERALRISKIGTAISAIIAIAAIVTQVYTNSAAATDLELAKSQIKELQKQVEALNRRK